MNLKTRLLNQLDEMYKNDQLFVTCSNCKNKIVIHEDTDISEILCPNCLHTVELKIRFELG